uniref:SH2B2 n=1 Tax=Macrostomum lignano TaxID=282301 RepID=A0A1I8FBP9_9PLAT
LEQFSRRQAGDAGSAPEPEEKTEEIAGETPGPGAWSDRLNQRSSRANKFNIFYPDLLDKSKAPSYSTEPCKRRSAICHPALHCWAAL